MTDIALPVGISQYRRVLAIVVLLLVAALACIALDHLFAEIRWSDVRAAFQAIPPVAMIAAAVLTGLSYLALTLYDHLALRIIGSAVGWRTAALASFCSYTLSHNLGLALVTGGSARLRIYGAAGLGPGDVARIIASASFAFWGGVFTLTALGMTLYPAGLTLGGFTIDAPVQRAIGATLLGGAILLLAALRSATRPVNVFGWTLTLPSRSQALAQIGIACIDLAFASAALFVLVPHLSPALYPAFFLGYALAIIVALISHVPGGIGIFEGVIVASLPRIDRPALVAALIAYRILYYLIPLFVAVVLIAAHERRAWRQPLRNVTSGAQTVARTIAPIMLAALVAVGGAILLISGSLPAVPGRFRMVAGIIPMPFVEASHLAASMIGALLILLASGLYRRLDGAFWLTRLLLVAGAIFSLLKGLDYEEAAILLVIAALLQWSHAAFYRRTSLTSAILTPGWIATLGLAVGLSIWIGFIAYRHVDYQGDLWWQFGRHRDASRFLRAALAAGVVLVGAALWALLRPARDIWDESPSDPPGDAALSLATRTDAFLALTGDKKFLTSPSGRAFLMYQVQGHSWIVMGDPVGDPVEWPDLLWRMRERADAAQGRLLLYQLSLESLPLAIDLGLSIVKYGEEARIDLNGFTLEGPQARPLRHAVRRTARDGALFDIVAAADVPALLPALRAVSDDWLAAKGATEKSFSVGRFDDAYMTRFDCAVVRCGGRIVAFANIWATADGRELSVDLMRHSAGAPPGVMDFIFTSLLLWGQGRGYRWFTLGLAPLSGLDARRLSPLWVKAAAFLYRHGDAFYGFGGLRAYKAKFAPTWEPRFIAGPQGVSLARAMVDLQRLIGGGRGSMAARMRGADPAVIGK
ncbi:bifunctional lysylphosphatidylglycerol flippase/synthetase MprF [Sphingobium sp. 3R8]|uniref:bifunctional lysylphosphatidylglycerol flippase/synthetase MprF n=1 Tax=Sphingobium sp. 3R8 TaxID=2874921 RepID=UPI001CCEDBCD|nr:bifunctional lysylphosphatidylglycerol flippase/synthetase MprF [Sphingobium sp. 3R8]MBZ9649655.1 bifunctional lysylphosphatidylglycerol flippase/synthetase MprF [Sphingobium sp. 3R8]